MRTARTNQHFDAGPARRLAVEVQPLRFAAPSHSRPAAKNAPSRDSWVPIHRSRRRASADLVPATRSEVSLRNIVGEPNRNVSSRKRDETAHTPMTVWSAKEAAEADDEIDGVPKPDRQLPPNIPRTQHGLKVPPCPDHPNAPASGGAQPILDALRSRCSGVIDSQLGARPQDVGRPTARSASARTRATPPTRPALARRPDVASTRAAAAPPTVTLLSRTQVVTNRRCHRSPAHAKTKAGLSRHVANHLLVADLGTAMNLVRP